MGTIAGIPSIDTIGPHCGNDNSLLSLLSMLCGCPAAVDSDSNPFQKRPENFTDNAWHLVRHDRIGDSEAASLWRPKGEARQITLGHPVTCWEVTREFHETDDDKNTNWMMLEYKITNTNESFSICRIWQDPKSLTQVGGNINPGASADQQQSPYDYPVENPSESEVFENGDYLELLDLDVPLVP